MRLVLLVATIMLSANATAAKLDLKQDLSGLDLTITPIPADNPDAIRITNNTAKVVTCSGNFTGNDAEPPKKVTIQPGKRATVRVRGNYADMPRSAEITCTEATKKSAKK